MKQPETTSGTETTVAAPEFRTPKHYAIGVQFDAYITHENGRKLSDLDQDAILDLIIDALTAKGYEMGGGCRLSDGDEDEEEDK